MIYSRMSGNSQTFGFEVLFERDPDNGIGATADEASSWGSFRIYCAGINLCAHVESGIFHTSTTWYLLPLFEWFVNCFDRIVSEEKLHFGGALASEARAGYLVDATAQLAATADASPTLSEDEVQKWDACWFDFWSHHNLRAARHGGLFPNITFRRKLDAVEISWDDSRPAGTTPETYSAVVGAGRRTVRLTDFVQPLRTVLLDAIGNLCERAPSSTRLSKLRRKAFSVLRNWSPAAMAEEVIRLQFADANVWNVARTALSAELPPRDLQRVVAVGTEQPYSYAALMFGSVSPTITQSDVVTLAKLIVEGTRPGCDVALEDYVENRPIRADGRIWNQGYDLAMDLLSAIKAVSARTRHIDVRAIIERLGIDVREDLVLDDETIRGVAICGPDVEPPRIFLNSHHPRHNSELAKRFSLAHELCHLLYDRGYSKRLAIASGDWAPIDVEKRANAFAAMFLMPATLIQSYVKRNGSISTWSDIRSFAEQLQVSARAAFAHLENLNVLKPSDALRISAQQLDHEAEAASPD